jgi:hypothetical protein
MKSRMLARASVSVATLMLLHTSLAAAQDDGDWFADESEVEAAEQEPESAEPEGVPPSEPTPSDQVRVQVVVDPERDEPVAGKPPRPGARLHDGFYLRLSIGGGSMVARGERYDASETGTDYSFEGNALAAEIAVGGSPTPGFVLGGAYQGVYAARGGPRHGDADTGISLALVGPFVDIYPDPRDGFHLGGMLGAAVTASHDERYEERSAALGFGGSLWVGYDLWIANQWSIGGLVRASAARVETPQNRVLDLERDRLGVASVALLVSAVYH